MSYTRDTSEDLVWNSSTNSYEPASTPATSGYLTDGNGNIFLFNGLAIYVKNYLRFNSSNQNIVERCTYTTLNNGVSVDATSSYGRASFYFPVISGKTYKLEFDSSVTSGYKMIYLSNKIYESGEGWSGTYTTLNVTTDGHKTYTFTSTSDVLWIGIYVTADTSVGNITITNVELNEIS